MDSYSVGAVGSGSHHPFGRRTDPSSQLLRQLIDLQRQDPVKLESKLMSMAENLNSAALKASGQRAQILREMADMYEDAARTGNLFKLALISPQMQGATRRASL